MSVSPLPRKPPGFRYGVLRLFIPLSLGFVCPTYGQSAEPALQLRGVLSIGTEWHAAIVADDTGVPRWCRPGERVGGFMITSVEAEAVTLVGADGASRVLHLSASHITDINAPPRDPAAWAAWVNSPANPMLETPAPLPVTPRQWLALTPEQRAALAEWYRLHGWSVEVQADPREGAAVEFAPLQGEVRQALLAERQQAFLRLLSPEQRTLHTAARRPGAPPTAAQVLAHSLDPAQRLELAELFRFSAPAPEERLRDPPAR